MKQKWATKIGATSSRFEVTSETTEESLLQHIEGLNKNHSVHGIMVQHPLPPHIDESRILAAVDVNKDVDGISPLSIGKLASRMQGHRAATPLGIIRLLDAYDIPIRGANVVVAGCSIILGRPMALMLVERDATVTMTHRYTKNRSELLRSADIIVAATGVPHLINSEDVKPGVVAIDCGYAIVDGKPIGDINYNEVAPKASYITPVPGGVGPMTVATLMSNLVDACESQFIPGEMTSVLRCIP
jgi:methylenetetrahydrofolate dehydrogenase (NADP+)/methenyltetrahydrofolate cyclohydrolase